MAAGVSRSRDPLLPPFWLRKGTAILK